MNDLQLQLIELTKANDDKAIKKLLEEKLQEEPNNIDLLLRLAIVSTYDPDFDEERCIECLEKVLTLNKNNATALLLLAYVQEKHFGEIDDTLRQRIEAIETQENETRAMLKYVASWFYRWTDNEKEKQCLIESINMYPGLVNNYMRLAELYFKENKNTEAKLLVEIGLKNVQKIYVKNNLPKDTTDINEFINGYIKGIFQMDTILEWIKEHWLTEDKTN